MTEIPEDVRRRVKARLRLAQTLIEHIETIADPKDIENRPEGGWTHPYAEHDALVSYLLLTCFDVLGQGEWIPFGTWLEASRSKDERKQAIDSLKETDPVRVAAHLLKSYTQLYGVKQNFMRFINELLDEKARVALLRSVRLVRGGAEVEDDAAKKAFLFEMRNTFTHRAVTKGQLSRLLGAYVVSVKSQGLGFYGEAIHGDGKYQYHVLGWPFTLYEIVADYMGEPVPEFAVSIWAEVDLEDGQGSVWIKELTWSDTKNPEALMSAAREHRATNPPKRAPNKPP